MKTQFATLTLAVLGGLGAMVVPNISQAANIGYVISSKCSGGSDGTSAIIAAGHTPVLLSTIDAASLAPLAGFVYVNCFGTVYPANAAIDAAVANGMTLFVFDKSIGAVSPAAATHLPGTPSLVVTSAPDTNVDIPAGSPAANGPGGPINNSSLDGTSYYTNRGSAALSSLPAGSTVLATTSDINKVVEFSYPYGQGRVVYGSIPIDVFLSGGSGEAAGDAATAGVKAFAANLFAWAISSTTCASSGYTGTQLTWCVKICESGLTGKPLEDWIHRWTRQFRKLPYCALPGGGGGGGGGE
jgi:hypothetical protein